MKLRLLLSGTEHELDVAWTEEGARVLVDGRAITVDVHRLDDHAFLLRHEGRRIRCAAAGSGAQRQLWANGRTVEYEVCDRRRRATAAEREHDLVAPLPGVVRQVLVAAGDQVSEGDTLVVVESMKMELAVRAAHGGVVEAVYCAEGQTVEAGEHLVALETGAAA